MAFQPSFRQVQVGVTSVVLLTTFAIVGVSSVAYTRASVAELSSQLLMQATQRVDLRVRGHVDVAVAQGEILADVVPRLDAAARDAYLRDVRDLQPDLHQVAFAIAPIEGGPPRWTATVPSRGTWVVSRVVPVRGGEIRIDLDLAALDAFFAEPIGHTGRAFVIEDGIRRVVAHAEPFEPIAVDESDDPVVRAFASQIPPDIHEFGGALVPVRFEVDGRGYHGAYQRVGGVDPPRWIVCAVLPDDDVLARIGTTRSTTLGVAAGGLVLALLMGLVSARVMSKGIVDLEEELHRIARFELSPVKLADTPSLVAELDDMRVAIDALKSGLRSFERYVPTGLVRRLVQSGGEARLGASRQELTILFADIAGFGDLTESVPPEELMAALGDYLRGMNDAIASTDGTVCQYLGDVVMAVWGAPDLQADHAQRACRGALAMQRHARKLATEARQTRHPALPTHFGVCSGNVLVGNIGAPNRFNFGALGDAVNTAARIGGLNKTYGTSLLIGETTADQLGGALITRPVDWVRMKGKVKPLVVHELLGEPGAIEERVRLGMERYAAGLAAYRAQRFEEADEAFRAATAHYGTDGPSRVMIGRCALLAKNPPPPGWDGVFTMATK